MGYIGILASKCRIKWELAMDNEMDARFDRDYVGYIALETTIHFWGGLGGLGVRGFRGVGIEGDRVWWFTV